MAVTICNNPQVYHCRLPTGSNGSGRDGFDVPTTPAEERSTVPYRIARPARCARKPIASPRRKPIPNVIINTHDDGSRPALYQRRDFVAAPSAGHFAEETPGRVVLMGFVSRLRSLRDTDRDEQEPSADRERSSLYQCTACGTVYIAIEKERCSGCDVEVDRIQSSEPLVVGSE